MTMDDPELSNHIKQFGTRHKAPDSLHAGLRTHLALTTALRTPQPAPSAPRFARWRAAWRSAGLRQGAAGFALGLAVMATVPPMVDRLGLGQPDEADVVAHHVRALRVGPLTEVISTDRHTVKPWFQGKLDYAPPVVDLAADGFPLLGGRVEHLNGDAIAALVYARNRHMIDLYVWPGSAKAEPALATHRGFHVLRWSDGAMQYRAVSDVEPGELQRFSQQWRGRLAMQ